MAFYKCDEKSDSREVVSFNGAIKATHLIKDRIDIIVANGENCKKIDGTVVLRTSEGNSTCGLQVLDGDGETIEHIEFAVGRMGVRIEREYEKNIKQLSLSNVSEIPEGRVVIEVVDLQIF